MADTNAPDGAPERFLAAILAGDVVGYSRLMGQDEIATLHALKAHLASILPVVAEFAGKIIDTAGDSILAEFPSAVRAVECALAIQTLLEERNRDLPEDRRMLFRIGVNLGDILRDDGRIYGDGVNIAARLQSLAEPGGICVSRAARDQIRDKLPVRFVDLGEQTVKNIARPIRVFRVAAAGEQVATTSPQRFLRASRPALLTASLVVMLALAFTFVRPGLLPEVLEPSFLSRTASSKPSIVVLPFNNVSSDSSQDYFADGFTDDLINQLSQISDLIVIARSSSFSLKGKSVPEAARDVEVRYVLEGSVRRAGDRLRINAQLVDGAGDHQIWAESYDRSITDLFALQDEVVGKIVSSLSLKLTSEQDARIARLPTKNLEAYDNYLRAERESYYNVEPNALRKVIGFYSKAIELDHNFAEAYAGYARVMVETWRSDRNELLPSALARKRAYDAAGQALALDARNARAYTVLAILQLGDKRHADAIASARRAIELNANDSEAHANLAFILSYSGEPEEAVDTMEQAVVLNPAPQPGFQLLAGITYYNARKYEQAIGALEKVREAWPSVETVLEHLAAAYALAGQEGDARRRANELRRMFPIASLAYYPLLYDYYKRREDLERHLSGLRGAGLPEWPFGFEGRDEDRIRKAELETLVSGKTWLGMHYGTKAEFIQEIDSKRRVAYRSATSFLTGNAEVRGDMLCLRFQGYFQDRLLCGPVYRNKDAGDGRLDTYISVLPESVRYFALRS
jgi:adenylate cyclase